MSTNQQITEEIKDIIFYESQDTSNLKISKVEEIKPEYKLADLSIVNNYFFRSTLKISLLLI